VFFFWLLGPFFEFFMSYNLEFEERIKEKMNMSFFFYIRSC